MSNRLGIKVIDYEMFENQQQKTPGSRISQGASMAKLTHELNNMLAVVMGGSDLIVSDADAGSRARQHADAIRHAAQRAAALVQQVMARGSHEN
jgi:signal transduction histidine kinase